MSVSDLMAGLLFVFIITLMVFALQFSSADVIRNELLEQIRKELSEAKIQVEVDTRHGILRVPEEILFDSGQAELPPARAKNLQVIGDVLARLLPCYGFWTANPGRCPKGHKGWLNTVLIEGHTDNVPLSWRGRFSSNWELSSARSVATYRFLVDEFQVLGSMKNRDAQPILGISAYADQRPLEGHSYPNPKPDAKNRRIDLRFVMAQPFRVRIDSMPGDLSKLVGH